ncbi:MAG: glycoside hydrolase domain-containing protein [Planctomycetota bacterium]
MRNRSFLSLGLVGLILSGLVFPAPAAETVKSPAAEEAGTTIMATGSYWRAFAMSLREEVSVSLLKETQPDATAPKAISAELDTQPPPADWMKAEFDDAVWCRSSGGLRPYQGVVEYSYSHGGSDLPPSTAALLCLRGRFLVPAPAGVRKLTLNLGYEGGAVVYLNGVEVARRHLPEGALKPGTAGEPYPAAAYAGDKESRRRETGPLALPVKLLKPGVNVIGIELHRSAFRPEALKWGKKGQDAWPHIGFLRLRLAADSDAGAIMPNVARPDGVQIWNEDPHRRFELDEYGDPNESLKPMKLVVAGNGYGSAQIVVGSTAALKGVKAASTDLAQEGGAGKIPAAEIAVRYVSASNLGWSPYPRDWVQGYMALNDNPPEAVEPANPPVDAKHLASLGLPAELKQAALLPIWVTVRVPKDAPAGKYKGALRLSGEGLAGREVPMEMEVIGWTLPEPAGFQTFTCVYQSPESLAVQYGTALWSEEHWKLLEKSWRLLGRMTNNLLVVPLVNHTQFGNDEGMIPWIKQPGGTYTYDFTVYDRYAALAARYCSIKMISYQVYLSSGWTMPGPDKPTCVTVVDPATGKREAMQLPAYGTPEAEKLWMSFIKELREHESKAGFHKDALTLLGISQDLGIHNGVVQFFKQVFPEAKWHYGAHHRPQSPVEKGMFALSEYMYVPWAFGSLGSAPLCSWQKRPVTLISQRIWDYHQPPMVVRTMVERALLIGDNGAGRMCLDFWPVKGSTKLGAAISLYDRWPESVCAQRRPHMSYLSVPGKDGACSTVKIEMYREGVQEAEARVFLEKAIAEKKVDGELAAKCLAVLNARAQFCRVVHSRPAPLAAAYDGGWQQAAADLYRLAAEVAAKSGK